MKRDPIVFVVLCHGGALWEDLIADPNLSISEEDLSRRIVNNEDCWIVLTYLRLRDAGWPVLLATELKPNAICAVSYMDVSVKWLVRQPKSAFLVGCQGDGPSFSPFADHCIVQSPTQISQRATLMPLWPQPGLMQRRAERGGRIESLTFKGSIENLWGPFRSQDFMAKLAQRGVRLDLGLKGDTGDSPGAPQWHDYRENDLVLAARDLTVADAAVKPPSKLINAWLAGVPALLGPEPAFQSLRKNELDYFEVRTPVDVLDAIDLLQREPVRFRAMIERGRERAMEFSNEAVLQQWVAYLWGTAMDRFKQSSRIPVWPPLARMAKFPLRWILHNRSKNHARDRRSYGPRVLTDALNTTVATSTS